jgi:hypothetical protein
MRDLLQKDIPGLGTVIFGSIAAEIIAGARNVARQADQSSQAPAFANAVLASMFMVPKQTPEDIDRFPADALAAVIEVAVDELHIREYFETATANLSAREILQGLSQARAGDR